jgi:hypothetical protein
MRRANRASGHCIMAPRRNNSAIVIGRGAPFYDFVAGHRKRPHQAAGCRAPVEIIARKV